jgi:hypothetical protein
MFICCFGSGTLNVPLDSRLAFNSSDRLGSLKDLAHFICSSMKLIRIGGTGFPVSLSVGQF